MLKEINADIIALQEVHCVQGRDSQSDQAHFIARELGFNYCMGHNRKLKEEFTATSCSAVSRCSSRRIMTSA